MADELITIDFTEYDSVEAAKFLVKLFEEGKASGMIFAVNMKRQPKQPRIMGVTGKLADNSVEAAGLAAILHLHLSKLALNNHH